MKLRDSLLVVLASAGVALAGPASNASAQTAAQQATQEAPTRRPDVIFVPTPQAVVDEMLNVAKVGPNDVLFDLGSGDGRIAITAAKRGARATGIDIDSQRIKEANENARKAGMADKVKFMQADLFEQDFSSATVITLYLLPDLNLKLRPKLLQLKPGTRIVSHDFDMGDWTPDRTLKVDNRTIHFWTVPTPDRAAQIGKTKQ